ncbi:Angiopoietin-related protein 4 [Liparis tanakae]|uniref:Angiopoietin-related protein 4 n=1 Tax=Liparis tanakae TaxID=230148 RepID=A0A4Z2EHT9_9TELE|nr:Angiopoietin-related protein 4 [Liparis tanakae]
MNMPQVLILVTILVLAADAFPSDRSAGPGRDKRDSWDDMNLLAHGLLQLGQGLKEHVDKTRGQMRAVDAKLKAFNGSLAELQRAQRERDGAMEARTKELEEEERGEEVKTQSEDIHARMDRLEEKVDEVLGESTGEHNNSDHTGAPSIQVRRNITSERVAMQMRG